MPNFTARIGANSKPGWYDAWEQRLSGALCRINPSVAWTQDGLPSDDDMAWMSEICERCPVREACAEYALDPAVRALGGMYAGVWIPWRSAADSQYKSARELSGAERWQNARTELRRFLRRREAERAAETAAQHERDRARLTEVRSHRSRRLSLSGKEN